MSDDIIDGAATPQGNGERPTFLTVLCILTFIGSGLGIIGNLLALAGGSFLGGLGAAAGGLIIWAILGLVASGLCLFGAIQMWGLKKQGFMLYAAGAGIAILVSIVSTLMLSGDFQVSWGAVGFGVAINAAFVAMYNQNRPALIH